MYTLRTRLRAALTRIARRSAHIAIFSPEDYSMKLLDQVREVLRLKHYSYRTEQCYIAWIVRFIRHHGLRHLNTMGQNQPLARWLA